MTSFVNTADVLELSERPSAVFLRLKQVIEDTDLKPKKYSWVLLRRIKCYDWQRKWGCCKKHAQCESMLNVHCICDRLALVCAYARDDLQFIQNFEATGTQLWAFVKAFLNG